MLSQRAEESREFPYPCSVCRDLSQASAIQYSSNVDTGGNFPKHVRLQHNFHLKSEGFVHAGARNTSGNWISAMTDAGRAVISSKRLQEARTLQLEEVAGQGSADSTPSGQ